MKWLNNKAIVFIYILLVINVALVFSVIVFNNSHVLGNNIIVWNDSEELFAKIYEKWNISINAVRKFNSNWLWFSDSLSCPTDITMSWTTNSGSNLTSSMVNKNKNKYCRGTYLWEDFRIYFNVEKNWFDKIYYKWKIVNLSTSTDTQIQLWTNNIASSIYTSNISASTAYNNYYSKNYTIDWDNDKKYISRHYRWSSSIEYDLGTWKNLWLIKIKKDNTNIYQEKNRFSNKVNVYFYNEFNNLIKTEKIPSFRKKEEIIIDLQYFWLDNQIKKIEIYSDWWYLNINDIEIYELESIWSEEIWEWVTDLWDTDSTFINFNKDWIWWWDTIDDDYDSDNYRVTSFWDTYYLDWYQDDDVVPRKTFFWNIKPVQRYINIFWNNYKTEKYIDENIYNDDILNDKMWNIDKAYMFLDLYNKTSNNFDLKIIEFDKDKFKYEQTLLPLKSSNWKWITSFLWYINIIDNELSISKYKTWNEYVFDFVNKDYAIFIQNNSDDDIVYKLYAETDSWRWIYINPIDDSWDWTIKVLANDIIIWWEKNFIWENIVVTWIK